MANLSPAGGRRRGGREDRAPGAGGGVERAGGRVGPPVGGRALSGGGAGDVHRPALERIDGGAGDGGGGPAAAGGGVGGSGAAPGGGSGAPPHPLAAPAALPQLRWEHGPAAGPLETGWEPGTVALP